MHAFLLNPLRSEKAIIHAASLECDENKNSRAIKAYKEAGFIKRRRMIKCSFQSLDFMLIDQLYRIKDIIFELQSPIKST